MNLVEEGLEQAHRGLAEVDRRAVKPDLDAPGCSDALTQAPFGARVAISSFRNEEKR